MGRKNRRREEEVRPLGPGYSSRTVESHPDGDWVVQKVTGSASTKAYRCPGCDQEIRPATPHTVAFRSDDPQGVEHRRHWHTPCWAARDRRGPRTGRY
ncbi:MAG: hypothetical protein GC156_14225 [Actinomycetales bacterium]|nr:hypothetical protein [Actinomycetales bacterium]